METPLVDMGGLADQKFVRQAMKVPMLEAEYERDLASRWRDSEDERALHELTTAYMRLVVSMATKFRHYGLPLPDLVQEGNIGLMQAAARFEPSREVRFSTYASWWIRSSIQDYVLRNWSIVRTGTTAAQKSLFFNLRRLRAKIEDTGEENLSPDNRKWIADQLGVPERDVDSMAARLHSTDRSLNAPMTGETETEWQDLIEDNSATPDQIVEVEHDTSRRREWIAKAFECLNEREQLIIQKRRLSDETVTLEVLGRQLGVSKERVRQIEHQALGKLRKALTNIVSADDLASIIPSL